LGTAEDVLPPDPFDVGPLEAELAGAELSGAGIELSPATSVIGAVSDSMAVGAMISGAIDSVVVDFMVSVVAMLTETRSLVSDDF
jgi:hypothetical protein